MQFEIEYSLVPWTTYIDTFIEFSNDHICIQHITLDGK